MTTNANVRANSDYSYAPAKSQNANEAWLIASLAAIGAAQHYAKDDSDRNTLVRALMLLLRKHWRVWMAEQSRAVHRLIVEEFASLNIKQHFKKQHIAREMEFERLMRLNSLDRIQENFQALSNIPISEWTARIRMIIAKERHYDDLHIKAMERRLRLSKQHLLLRLTDGRSDLDGGALWVLDRTKKEHTVDCSIMAGNVWSWAILRYINPANRHLGCGCQLRKASRNIMPRNYFPVGVDTGWDMGLIA